MISFVRGKILALNGKLRKLSHLQKILLTILLLVLVGVLIYALITRNDDDGTKTVSNSEVQKHYQEQLSKLSDRVKSDPDDVAARRNYAVALYVTGDLEKAKEQYEAAIKLNSKDAVLHNNLGNTYRDLKQYDKALKEYDAAIKIDNKNQNAYVNKANVQMNLLDKPEDAIATYKRAIKTMPKNYQLRVLLGLAYEQNDNEDQAKQTFKAILADDPKNQAAKSNLDRLEK